MLLNGFIDEEEVRNNFDFNGTILYADKFIDEDFNISGCLVIQREDGFYSIILRDNVEYGTKSNKLDSMYFNVENVFNNLKFSMYYVQSISIKDLKKLLLGV